MLRLAFLVGVLGASQAHAQTPKYPVKPIRLIMPYSPGGSGDFLARLVGSKLTEVWGQPVVVENKAGASGMIGTELVAKAPPDGYTLLLATDIQFAINPVLYPKISYDPDKGFEPITLAAFIEFVLVVPASLQVNSLAELVARAKANPGKLSYASTGTGSTHHLAAEMFKSRAAIDMNHVPYKGSGQALPDLVGGQVDVMVLGISQALPHIRSGKLKGLAVSSAKRLRAAPDIPTFSESYPGFEANAWWGFYAPAGTPKDVVFRLNTEIVKILNLPEVAEQLAKGGFEMVGSTPGELVARTRSDREKWGRIIKQANVKIE
jgi:tripartite-type tricarboxylate transporter receptor subunit TctC